MNQSPLFWISFTCCILFSVLGLYMFSQVNRSNLKAIAITLSTFAIAFYYVVNAYGYYHAM